MPQERRLVFEVSIQSGLRIGDVLKLRVRDVRRVSAEEAELAYIAEKTKKKGTARIYGKVAEQMFALKKGKKGFFWPSPSKSGHITRQSAWNWFKEAAFAAGVDVKGVSPHSLRKCFAVRLRHEKGLQAAQKALQHSDSATTAIYAYADIYHGVDPDAPVLWCQIGELVDLIAERLKQKKSS